MYLLGGYEKKSTKSEKSYIKISHGKKQINKKIFLWR